MHNGDIAQLRAEFEHFKGKDHKELYDRVTMLEKLNAALEKKHKTLQTTVDNLKIPSGSGGGISEERFMALVARVDALELLIK